jgi:hypothetical protein
MNLDDYRVVLFLDTTEMVHAERRAEEFRRAASHLCLI